MIISGVQTSAAIKLTILIIGRIRFLKVSRAFVRDTFRRAKNRRVLKARSFRIKKEDVSREETFASLAEIIRVGEKMSA